MTELTEKMKQRIKDARGIEGMTFKYGGVFDLTSLSREPVGHRALCRGEITNKKWVWLGDQDGPYEFENEKQARLFVKEIRKEARSRNEVIHE